MCVSNISGWSTPRKRLSAKQVLHRTLWVRLRYLSVSKYLAFLPRVSPKSPLEHLFKSVKVPFKKRSELTTKKTRRRSSEKDTPTAKDFFFFFETISPHECTRVFDPRRVRAHTLYFCDATSKSFLLLSKTPKKSLLLERKKRLKKKRERDGRRRTPTEEQRGGAVAPWSSKKKWKCLHRKSNPGLCRSTCRVLSNSREYIVIFDYGSFGSCLWVPIWWQGNVLPLNHGDKSLDDTKAEIKKYFQF